jgi:hypothetical protein
MRHIPSHPRSSATPRDIPSPPTGRVKYVFSSTPMAHYSIWLRFPKKKR